MNAEPQISLSLSLSNCKLPPPVWHWHAHRSASLSLSLSLSLKSVNCLQAPPGLLQNPRGGSKKQKKARKAKEMSSAPMPGTEMPPVEACAEFVDGVATRDVRLDELIWVRIFLPHSKPQDTKAKPVVLYAHGGCYCIGKPSWPLFHAFCASMCKLSNSIWVSLAYRLAPAHRLPAAYDDASFALSWLASQAQQQTSHTSDPWLTEQLANFSNCFLAGESAGAAIILKAAMDAAPLNLGPVCIKGLLLVHPGFHSEKWRREKVHKNPDELRVEKLYGMALPIGETLDYPPINPIHVAAPPLTPLSTYPHVLISVAGADFRYDVTLQFYELLQAICPYVVLVDTPGKGHAFHLQDPLCPEAYDLRAELVSFIHACITT